LKPIHEKLSRIPGAKRFPRYWRHVTPLKLLNALLVEWGKRTGKTRLSGYPYKIIIDTCNICNLRCRLCPTGMKTLKRNKGYMTFDTYVKIMEQLKPYALEVELHNWGEPFLNPDIFRIIQYTAENGMGTTLSSNLNKISQDAILQIIESGLEHLVVSLDGVTKEVYEQYRVGGDFKRVMDNLNAIIQKKSALKSRTPIIEWQYLVMKHNEHEMATASALAGKMGVDLIRFVPAGLPFEDFSNREMVETWMPENQQYWHFNPRFLRRRDYIVNEICFFLYRSITVNPDGGVSPCCVVYDDSYDFGSLLHEDIKDIWNNDAYISARSLFSRRKNEAQLKRTVCHKCRLFRKV